MTEICSDLSLAMFGEDQTISTLPTAEVINEIFINGEVEAFSIWSHRNRKEM